MFPKNVEQFYTVSQKKVSQNIFYKTIRNFLFHLNSVETLPRETKIRVLGLGKLQRNAVSAFHHVSTMVRAILRAQRCTRQTKQGGRADGGTDCVTLSQLCVVWYAERVRRYLPELTAYTQGQFIAEPWPNVRRSQSCGH